MKWAACQCEPGYDYLVQVSAPQIPVRGCTPAWHPTEPQLHGCFGFNRGWGLDDLGFKVSDVGMQKFDTGDQCYGNRLLWQFRHDLHVEHNGGSYAKHRHYQDGTGLCGPNSAHLIV